MCGGCGRSRGFRALRFFLALLFFSLQVAVMSSALAEHADEPESTPVAEPTSHPVADDVLNKQVVDFVTDKNFFHWTTQDVEKNFKARLQPGLTGATSKTETKEDAIGGVLADLFGTINDTQMKRIVTAAIAKK